MNEQMINSMVTEIDKTASLNKEAIAPLPSLGGKQAILGHSKVPLQATLGWSHLLGLLPVPTAGLRVGNPHGFGIEAGLQGILPSIGLSINSSGQLNKMMKSYPRSLWGVLKDRRAAKKAAELAAQQAANAPMAKVMKMLSKHKGLGAGLAAGGAGAYALSQMLGNNDEEE